MSLELEKIREILVSENYVSETDMSEAVDFAKKNHVTFLEYLYREELLNRETLGNAIAEFYKVPYFDFENEKPKREIVTSLPEELAKKYNVVYLGNIDDSASFATDNFDNQTEMITEIKKIVKTKKINLYYTFSENISEILNYYKKSLVTRFGQIIKDQKRIAPEIIEEIVCDAIDLRASDIHFEPQEEEVVVRFRVDGVLQEVGRIPKGYYENILNRIKVLAQLRIDEHYATQDGAIRFTVEEREVDMRISIAPTLDGEKVTIRLLAEYVRDLSLSDLGLSENDQKELLLAAKKPFGMILVTGPTGSGKTTTLYSLLKFLNDPGKNITTIEDPVEYKLLGTNQIQVNPEKKITFSEGLRSIVRQDPDIILVGEIRDRETAEISVNAALTGHLLFSTFHANDAATAVPRLLDMEIEPFLLASTLNLVIAQRLVRKLCTNCRQSENVTLSELKTRYTAFAPYLKEMKTVYKSKGCEACNETGYRGRIALFEYIKTTHEIQDLIVGSPSSKEIWDLARKQGSKSLLEDGIEKVKKGETTLDELSRVVSV